MRPHNLQARRLLQLAINAARSVAWRATEADLIAGAAAEQEYLKYCRENGIEPLPIEVHS
jgi:hypothetical protein